jgi:subtilisin family serine protease
MMHPIQRFGVVLSAAIAVGLFFSGLSAAVEAPCEPGQIIVKFIPEVGTVSPETKDGIVSVGLASLDARLSRHGISRIEQVFPHKASQLSHIYQFDFDTALDVRSVARDFTADEHLIYAEPRYIHRICDSPNDPNFQNGLQWFFSKVMAAEAWDITHGDPSVVIGIVDTGVDKNHPDLSGNLWFNLGEDVDGSGGFTTADWNLIDDDGNGYVDDWFGWDFQGLIGIPDNQPDEGGILHGTHTAGICCGVTDNNEANAGMSWNCSYMAVKTSRDGEEEIRMGYEGIQYAADNGAAVICLAWARADTASAFEQEIIDSAAAKGAILVAAAGNDTPGEAYSPPDVCPVMYPAAYDHVVAVAATDIADRAASFTYYGPWVDVCAPGNGMYSHLWDDSYGMRSSTSAACAMVAGVAGLAKVIDPEMSSDLFRYIVYSQADDIDALNPTYAGWLGGGRLNAYQTLNFVSVEDPQAGPDTQPRGYALFQNYPNPFNPSTTIDYALPAGGPVKMNIYNIRGQLVRTLIDQEQAAGSHSIQWDSRTDHGRTAASGIYFYRLTYGDWSHTRKMVLMK